VKSGSLNIQGVPPTIIGIYLSQGTEYLCSDTVPANCPMNGAAGGSQSITVKAVVQRNTGDCDSGVTMSGYVCNNTLAICHPSSTPGADYQITSGWSMAAKSGIYCNYTNTFSIDYFKHNGPWTINISAASANGNNNTRSRWYYTNLTAFSYPYVPAVGDGSSVPLGSVTLGLWNFGVGANISKNQGNMRLSLTWNATNFTSGANSITVHNYTFCVQNISGNPFASTDNYQNMTSPPGPTADFTPLPFYPSSGVLRCNTTACDKDEFGNTYPNNLANDTLWWSIFVPMGQAAGTYMDAIQFNVAPTWEG
jgi:hypothetical protein